MQMQLISIKNLKVVIRVHGLTFCCSMQHFLLIFGKIGLIVLLHNNLRKFFLKHRLSKSTKSWFYNCLSN